MKKIEEELTEGIGGGKQHRVEPDGPWSPLWNPLFRSLWIANLVSNTGTWMQSTAMAWLMATIAPSALMVSLVQTASSFPIFMLALPAGALADVLDRRSVIIFTQSWMLVAAAILGVLTIFGLTTPWLLLFLVLVIGIGTALNAPAWQAIIPELVPPKQIHPAVALNSAGFNLARSIGPALGGLVLVAFGSGVTFLINAASFLGVILVILRWKRAPRTSALPAERILAAMRTGVRFVRYAPALQAVFIRALLFILCASAIAALLPLFARNYLHVGPSGYGLLLGAFGVGAVAGAAVLPATLKRMSLDSLAIWTTLIYAAAVAFMALVPVFAASCAGMFLAGSAWLALLSSFNSSVQSIAPGWVRGRCLAVYMLVFFGGMSAGSFFWGAVADVIGIPFALHLSAAGLVLSLASAGRFRLSSRERPDLTPSAHWSSPAVIFEPRPEEGPILVNIEYLIDPADWHEFGLALKRLKRARLRSGAFSWAVFKDLHDPEKYRETFLVESWLEHLRQHERLTVADQVIEHTVRSFHRGESPPVIRHLLARPLPED